MSQLPSKRHGLPGNDPIFALSAEAQRRRLGGEDILDLSLGTLRDEGGAQVVLDSVMEAWRQLNPLEVASYAPIAGSPAFLRALVQWYWPQVDDPFVACATPGGSGALALSARTFLEPGMRVLTGSPGWGPYALFSSEQGLGLATAPFPYPGEALDLNAWRQAMEELASSQGRLLLWLNEPCHNPTGWSLEALERISLIELCRELATRVPVTVVLDAAYLDYPADPGAVRSALEAWASLAREGEVLVGASRSLSKALTLYGVRCGALAFPWSHDADLQAALGCACRGLWSCTPTAPQALFTRLVEDGRALAGLLDEQRHWRERLEGRAVALNQALKVEGLKERPWRGGFFLGFPHPDPEGLAARLQSEGIFTVPAAGGLRLGLCALRQDQAPRLATALRKCR